MKKETLLTTAQFAQLHNVNKRTLHYYDEIGLFSPKEKGENQYRYYEISQSLTFEYIRMLKDLNMSIDEIKSYMDNPNAEDFFRIADAKTVEINRLIKKLKQTQKLLSDKRKQIEICRAASDMEIHIVTCAEEKLITAPYDFEENDSQHTFVHLKEIWGIEQCRAGIGLYISADRLLKGDFDSYDGLFSPVADKRKTKGVFIKPGARYLCSYCRGAWERIPEAYRQMVSYAREHRLTLTGYAYEWGMNEFVIKDENQYITRIMIQLKDEK